MKKCIAAIVLFLTVFIASCGYHRIDTLTYAVYPYIPDAEYYQEIIERRWKEIEPNIKLVRAEWDCYYDGAPEGIDVIMYDAVMRDALIENGWIQPIDPDTEANPMEVEDTDGMMELIDRLAIDTHKRDDSSSCLNL